MCGGNLVGAEAKGQHVLRTASPSLQESKVHVALSMVKNGK